MALEVPDGWEWRLIDVACPACGAVNQFHEQPPEWLQTPEGVKWECRVCSTVNTLGGQPAAVSYPEVLECGECHRTYDGREGATVEMADDGSWSCVGCGTTNRYVATGDQATATTEVSR